MTIIAIGSDHAGYAAKEFIKSLLQDLSYNSHDYGCFDEQSVHYPEFGQKVAQAVSGAVCASGILICGTGIGMSIVANKVCGIRAALCHNTFTAVCSREHNNANILVMGARVLSFDQMAEITRVWLATPFAGGRHETRLAMIQEMERINYLYKNKGDVHV
ncbi:MAG: ribose 5-phosphate isomerase B [Firmicutes bacterium]|nr:ribose 5-phosphate isomerase B [Bacillota bacterium]